jgi:general secretion pathway protein C
MAIETLVRRGFPGVVLVLLATAAYLQAQGLAQLLGAWLERGEGASHRVTLPRDATEPKSGRAIRDRNPFDSVTGPFRNEPPARLSADLSDPLSSPICPGIQVLIVTESSDPWWSLATLRESSEARPRLRRVGDGVAGKQVAFIGYNPKQQAPAVWIEGSGKLCQSMLFRPAVEAAAPEPGKANDKAKIQKLSDTEFKIDRSVVDEHLEDPLTSFSSLRFVPDRKDGKLIGLRLFGIRPGSLLNTLGLQNGDRLESINGFSIASPQQALEAYAHLSTAKRLSVRVVRLGRPLQIDLNIS